MIYNYYRAVRDDVLDYIHNEIDYANYETTEELEQYLRDELWVSDITGNASGSYYCNSWKAEESLSHNWDLLVEALDTFGMDNSSILHQGPEAMDVAIRCYLLDRVIRDVLYDIEEEFDEAHEHENDEEDSEEY